MGQKKKLFVVLSFIIKTKKNINKILYLSELVALVEDVIQHNAVEGRLFQEEVHANRRVVADIELANLEETPAVTKATDGCLIKHY